MFLCLALAVGGRIQAFKIFFTLALLLFISLLHFLSHIQLYIRRIFVDD